MVTDTRSFRLCLPGLMLLSILPSLVAASGPIPPDDFATTWFLVRLSTPLAVQTSKASRVPSTGHSALDALIVEMGVRKIDNALAVSSQSPRNPEALRRHGLDRTYKFHVAEGSDILSLVGRFSQLPGVEFAEPDYIGHSGALVPNDTFFSNQWGFDQASDADVDGPEAWDIAVGSGVVIAVLDTGIDSDHVDLVGKILPGFDFVNGDSDPEDDHGHGTNVASVSSAVSNNATGIVGSCWDCQIMPLKVLDATNSGFYSWWTDAMVWATDNGARVINLSAGGFPTSPVLLSGVQYAYDAGVIHVSITHNQDLHFILYPGNYPETITVGATDELDQRVDPFCFSATSGSNFGSRTDVMAPGELILGAALGGGYDFWCGTSQAAPLVAGLVGIMETIYPSVGREEARHLIRSGAEDQVGRPGEDTAGWDIYHGWGRVNMNRTLQGTEASITLRVDGVPPTALTYNTANPLANSYDFIRADLGALSESAAGVDLGPVVCLEDDSLDPNTTGNADAASPNLGEAFTYFGRFNAAAVTRSYGGSSLNRDRWAASDDCPICGDQVIEGSEVCDGADIGLATCQSQGLHAGVLGCSAACDGFDLAGCAVCGNDICEPVGGRVQLIGPLDHVSKGLAFISADRRLLSVSRDDDLLRDVDVTTGLTLGGVALTLAGSTVNGATGLALNPATSSLFGILKLAGQSGRELVTIGIDTGVCTSIGNTGDNFASIAFTLTGTLYGVTGDGAATPQSLFTLSTTDATSTFVMALSPGVGISAGEALGSNPDDGFLYRASGFGVQNLDEIFHRINPGTLGVTGVILKGDQYSEATAMTYEGSGVLLLTDVTTGLFRIVSDGEDCLSCPQDCNGLQTGDPGSQFCCGDGEGVGPVSCGDARCIGGGNTCVE